LPTVEILAAQVLGYGFAHSNHWFSMKPLISKLTATKSLVFKKVAEDNKIGRFTHQKDPLVGAARNGLSLGTDDFRTEDREREVDLLLQILPDHSIIFLLELNSDAFDCKEPNKITALFQLTARARGWSATELSRFLATYCKVLVWLDKNNYPIQLDGKVAAIYLILYFEEYCQGFLERTEKQIQKLNSKTASSRAAQDGTLGNVLLSEPPDQQSVTDGVISPTDHNGVSGLRSISADMQPRTGVRKQKGMWSGHWGHRGLAWGQDNLKLPWNMANVPIESGVKGKRPDPPAQADLVTTFMVECLENLIMNPLTSLVAKHLVAAYIFCCYAVMRVEQAQSCWIDAVRDNEFVKGYVFLDKNPRRAKMQPRPWWAPLYGLTGTKLWFETLFGSLRDVSDKCYIFRAFASQDGSVKNATGLLPGPLLQEHGLMAALQEVLRTAYGFTVEQSLAYTLHSPFLPEVAAARGEPGTCWCKIGRWSQSVAQLASLRPETNMVHKHRDRAARLPDLYAKKTTLHSVPL